MLEATHLSFQAKDGKKILKDINLKIEKKTSVGIIGMNGCGKTTLLKCLANLHQEVEGDIQFLDQSIKSYSKNELAQKMAMMHQVNHFPFDFTTNEIIEMGRYPFNEGRLGLLKSDKELINKVIKLLQLEDKTNEYFSTLSGGEKQRVLLARSLVQTPELLILDEPTNHLDAYQQKLILRLIKELNLTTVSVLHDLNLAYDFCDVIYMLKDGCVQYAGETKEVMTVANIKEVFEIDVDILKSERSKEQYIVTL